MTQLNPDSAQWKALKKIVKRLPAQLAYYVSVMGAIVIAGSGTDGTVSIVGNIGAGLLGNLIAEVAKGKDVHDIRQRAEEAVTRSDIKHLVTERDFWRVYVQLMRRLEAQKAASQDILDDLRDGFSKVATAAQMEEVRELLLQVLKDKERLPQSRVFISYRRSDASGFAQRLHDALEDDDIDAWLDVRDMPSGDTFIAQIDRAIAAADYFLLVGTPQAIESDYCRDEWKKAIEKYKPIIPVMLMGEYNDLPQEAYAYLNDARDFRDDSQFDAQVAQLVKQIQVMPTPAGEARGLPTLPSHYLPRRELLATLREALTQHKTTVLTSPSQKVGVQGMGGIGKSVLAMALARDYFVRRTFKDGIFWLTLGTAPRLFDVWAQLAAYLGYENKSFKDAKEAQDFFEQATHGKEILLILDDIWDNNHAEAFFHLGENCRLFASSRQKDILSAIDAHTYTIGILSDPEAEALLKRVAKVDVLPLQGNGIIQACGNLPLAIAMIGAMVKGKSETYWQDALDALNEADLEGIAARFPEYPHANLFLALKVSIDVLGADLRERYYDFAIFPDDVAIPEEVPLTFWKPTKARDVRKRLDELVSRNLLTRADDGALSLHDLQLSYLRREVQDKPTRHRRLLSQYRPKSETWWDVCDAYLWRNLAYHLYSSEDYISLRALFDSPDWMYARLAQSNYSIEPYLMDLDFAWRDSAYQQIKDDPNQTSLMFDNLRFALIRTTFNSIAAANVPELVVQAVKLDVWPVARALATAKLSQNTRIYSLLLREKLIPDGLLSTVQSAAIQSAFYYQSSMMNQANDYLVELFPLLSQDFIVEAIDCAFMGSNINRTVATLEKIRPHLSYETVELIRKMIEFKFREVEQAPLLRAIELSEHQVDESIMSNKDAIVGETEIQELLNGEIRHANQLEIVLHVLSSQNEFKAKNRLIIESIKWIFRRPDVELFPYFIRRIGPFLATDHIGEIVGRVEQSDVSWLALQTLQSLENMLIDEQRNKLIEHTLLAPETWVLAQLVSKYGSLLTENQRGKVLRLLINAISTNLINHYAIEAVINLLPYLETGQIDQVFRVAENITTSVDRAMLLSAISKTDERRLGLIEAMDVIPSIPKTEDKFKIAALLAPQISNPHVISKLFTLVSLVDDMDSQAVALSALSIRINDLTVEEIGYLFDVLLQTLNEKAIKFSARILTSNQCKVLTETLVNQADDNKFWKTLPTLIMHVEQDTQHLLLQRILRFTDVNRKVDLLAFLVLNLASEIGDLALAEGLRRLDDMDDIHLYGIAASIFAQKFDSFSKEGLLQTAMTRIENSEVDVVIKALTLSQMLPYAQEPEITHIHQRVFEYMRSTKTGSSEIIKDLAVNLDKRWLKDAIEIAHRSSSNWVCAEMLNNLALGVKRTDDERVQLARLAYGYAIKIKAKQGRIKELARCAVYLPESEKLEAIEMGLAMAYTLDDRSLRIEAILRYWQFLGNLSEYRNRVIREIMDYVIEELYYEPRSKLLEFITEICSRFSAQSARITFEDIKVICKKWNW